MESNNEVKVTGSDLNSKKERRKSITKEEMEEIVNALFDKIKSEMDNNEKRIYCGLHKQDVDMMEIIMERILDLEKKIDNIK